jgi:3-methyladenine DNA glycosylase AlkD
MNVEETITLLKQKSNPVYLAGMKRFGINDGAALGIPIPELRKLARGIKRYHALAFALWESGFHEARILASIVDDPAMVTQQQIDSWVYDFNSWDLCDQVCGNLFDRTPFAVEKAVYFCGKPEEYVKRAGFVLMAEYAVHNKTATNEAFINFLPHIVREANDDRNFVKKSINWALRQIGKRNNVLNLAAIETARQILLQNNKTAKWVASNALSELSKRVIAE